MGMVELLCSMSPKRLAMIERDPEVLTELIVARHEGEIPGLLDLGNTWDALDIMFCDGKDDVLSDALVARNGKKLKAEAAHGKARMIGASRVAEIAKALNALPESLVTDRDASLSPPMRALVGYRVHDDPRAARASCRGVSDTTFPQRRVIALFVDGVSIRIGELASTTDRRSARTRATPRSHTTTLSCVYS